MKNVGWKSLMDRTENTSSKSFLNNESLAKRNEENKKTARIFNVNDPRNNTITEENNFMQKKKYSEQKALGRTGSLSCLFDKTDTYEKRNKLHSDKMTKDSNFFIPAEKPPKRAKHTVDSGLDSKDPLNTKIPKQQRFDMNNKTL